VTPKDYGSGRLIYLMHVERAFTYAEYFRYASLRPRVDNIYRPKTTVRDFGTTQSSHHI
jgi:hypothetical protein